MMFSISFCFPEIHLEDGRLLLGKVYMDSTQEGFAADLSLWSKEDYIRHWQASILELNNTGLATVFCCCRGKESSDIWAVLPRADSFFVYNLIAINEELIFNDNLISLINLEELVDDLRQVDASVWEISGPFVR